jgi:hypothetical protein
MRPEASRVAENSGLNIPVTGKSGEDLAGLADAAISFLRNHDEEVRALRQFDGIEAVYLDFGIEWRQDVVTQEDYLPPELVRLAGKLDLGICISHYPISR